TVMLAQSTDSGQLIASAVIKLLHAMKLQVQDLRGVGIQVQQLEGNRLQPQDCRGSRTRSIKDMLLGQGSNPITNKGLICRTSKETPVCRQTPKHSRTRLNFSIEIPSPSQVDRSVLEALPAELREQVEQSWTKREERRNHCHLPDMQLSSPNPCPALYAPPAGTLLLQFPNQPDGPGIDELKSAYSRANNAQAQAKMAELKNPLLQLKQPTAETGVGRVKRRYKRKNGVSPVKKGTSPLKRRQTEINPSTSQQDIVVSVTKSFPRPVPTLAGACDLTDIKTLLREWVTTITGD
ncbi:hypothetical protein GOODEAATRI_026253, partial [Goodea atripinnis]